MRHLPLCPRLSQRDADDVCVEHAVHAVCHAQDAYAAQAVDGVLGAPAAGAVAPLEVGVVRREAAVARHEEGRYLGSGILALAVTGLPAPAQHGPWANL